MNDLMTVLLKRHSEDASTAQSAIVNTCNVLIIHLIEFHAVR